MTPDVFGTLDRGNVGRPTTIARRGTVGPIRAIDPNWRGRCSGGRQSIPLLDKLGLARALPAEAGGRAGRSQLTQSQSGVVQRSPPEVSPSGVLL